MYYMALHPRRFLFNFDDAGKGDFEKSPSPILLYICTVLLKRSKLSDSICLLESICCVIIEQICEVSVVIS